MGKNYKNFEFCGSKRRIYLRRKPIKILNDECLAPTVKHAGESV